MTVPTAVPVMRNQERTGSDMFREKCVIMFKMVVAFDAIRSPISNKQLGWKSSSKLPHSGPAPTGCCSSIPEISIFGMHLRNVGVWRPGGVEELLSEVTCCGSWF